MVFPDVFPSFQPSVFVLSKEPVRKLSLFIDSIPGRPYLTEL